MPQERITVMGLGNPLMRDEGVGVRVVVEEVHAANPLREAGGGRGGT